MLISPSPRLVAEPRRFFHGTTRDMHDGVVAEEAAWPKTHVLVVLLQVEDFQWYVWITLVPHLLLCLLWMQYVHLYYADISNSVYRFGPAELTIVDNTTSLRMYHDQHVQQSICPSCLAKYHDVASLKRNRMPKSEKTKHRTRGRSGGTLNSHSTGPGFDPCFDNPDFGFQCSSEITLGDRWLLNEGSYCVRPTSRDGVVVRLLASHLDETCSISGRVDLGFSLVGIVPDDAAGRRVFSGISRFPRPFVPALLHTHSLHLNLFTHYTTVSIHGHLAAGCGLVDPNYHITGLLAVDPRSENFPFFPSKTVDFAYKNKLPLSALCPPHHQPHNLLDSATSKIRYSDVIHTKKDSRRRCTACRHAPPPPAALHLRKWTPSAHLSPAAIFLERVSSKMADQIGRAGSSGRSNHLVVKFIAQHHIGKETIRPPAQKIAL
ncbi:hypothetical protein PR048_001293 [Dryococelus australis]|uniref:Uncharacterized protein n=1 Tax=Dryococelus australis TaxID=614101 RepID=A0ABQ9IGZ4_9NEOP|nr:hypothetical protein PR048_001293 [Dryococelus australis]